MTRLWSNLDPAAVVRNCPASEIEAILRDAVAEIGALSSARDGWRVRHEWLRESLEVARARIADLEEGGPT